MKSLRIPILALVLILALTPASLATSYGSLTLDNFHIERDDLKPVDVDASLTVGYGGVLPEGPARLDFEVTGEDKLAFGGTATFEDGLIRAVLEKSKYRFEIPVKGFEDVFSQSSSSMMYNLWYVLPPELYYSMSDAMYYGGYGGYGDNEDTPKPEDFQKAWDLLRRYAAYYQKSFDPAQSRERNRKLFEILKPEPKGREAVDLFGKYTNLYRYEMAFAGSDLKIYFDAVYQADPEFKALEEEAAKLMEDLGLALDDKKDDDEKPEDRKADDADSDAKDADSADGDSDEESDLLDRWIEEIAIDKITYVIWSDTEVIGDAASMAQKSLVTLTVKDAVDEYGMPVVLEVPIRTESQQLKQGIRLGGEIVVEPYKGESTKISFHAMLGVPGKDGGTVSDVKATLDVNSEEGGVAFSGVLTGKETVDARGVGDTDLRVKGTSNDQAYSLGYAYQGKTSTEAQKSGTVTLSYSLPLTGIPGVPMEGSIRFDSLVESGPYRPADFEKYKDLQPVNPLRASYKAMEKVSGDLSSIMMQGMGVLMQTHGLSSLLGGLMSGMIPQ